MTSKKKIAILGAGSWGTAVAIHLANCNHDVLLWGHHSSHIEQMIQDRQNARYLPAILFPDNLKPVSDLDSCIDQAEYIFLAVPSHAFGEVLFRLPKPTWGLAWLTKGVDPKTHQLLSQLVASKWGEDFPIAVVSGPSFAKEVAQFLPTALTLAGNNLDYQKSIQSLLHQKNIRVYMSNDVVGIQLCGAIKNVLAIACGISDGLGYGANAKAALITRGLAEMTRLGIKMGARDETFRGLAGLGDLVLTCTDNQSRNRRFGLQIGQGLSIEESEKLIGQVVEGKHNARHVCYLASKFNSEMPICYQVNELLNEKLTPAQAAYNLMTRDPKEE